MLFGLTLVWPFSPIAILFLLVLIVLYALGLRHARQHPEPGDSVKRYHLALFFLAILIMAAVLLTPFDSIARNQLFSVHIVQLVTLTTVCAPLILFGTPAPIIRPALNMPVVGTILRFFIRPLIASVLFNLLFLLWHSPLLLHVGSESDTSYTIEVLSIFVASLLNWWPLIGSMRQIHKMSYPIQIAYAFFDGQPVDILAFVIVFTEVSIYQFYAVPMQLQQLGLTPFADQAVGGAILLVPGIVDLIVMSPLFFRWLGQIEAKAKKADVARQLAYEAATNDEYEYDDYEDDDEDSEDDETEQNRTFRSFERD